MAKNFNIVADIQLRGPKNIRGIASQIKSGLSGIKAKVDVDISRGVTTRINNLNNNLQRVNSTLRAIRGNARNATTELQKMAAALGSLASIQKSFTFNSKFTNSMTKNIKKAKTEIAEFGEQSALAVRRFAAFAAPTAVLFGLIGAIKEGVSAAISFEKEMTRLSQVTGRSIENLGGLSGEITRLSTGLGVSSAELGNIATTLAQAGLSAKNTAKALEGLARSSLASSFTDIKSTTEGVIAVMAQFGVSADDLQGKLGSINAVSAQFAVESDDLVSVIRRTGGAFKASGGNLEELLALFTSVRATTRESADSIATGFRTIFTRLQRPRTIQYLKELGVTLTDTENKFIGPYEAVRRLNAALKDIEGNDPRFAAVVEELGGFRQVSKVIPLIQQFENAQKALNVAQEGQISIIEDSEIAQKSLANQIVKVKEEFLGLFRELTSDDSFKATVKLILDMSKGVIDLVRALKPLMPLLGALAATQLANTSGQFLSGFTSGLSKRGGPARRFAGGGLVPGSGRGDKTPLMAEPGEFVVRRNAVDKIGRGTLASINSSPQRFAQGDFVRAISAAGKDKALLRAAVRQELTNSGVANPTDASVGKIANSVLKGGRPEDVFTKFFGVKTAKPSKEAVKKASQDRILSSNTHLRIADQPPFGVLFAEGSGKAIETKVSKFRSLQSEAQKNAAGLSGLSTKALSASSISGNIHTFGLNPQLKGRFDKASNDGIDGLFRNILNAAIPSEELKAIGANPNNLLSAMKNQVDVSPIKGKAFEGFISGLTRQFRANSRASFDFQPSKNPGAFNDVFPGSGQLAFADAKYSVSSGSKSLLSVLSKAFASARGFNTTGTDFLSILMGGGAKKAKGGGIKANEVPIIAEPGEFIINKQAAGKLGPKKLRSLNNADRMHTGGFVGYAKGGSVSPTGLSKSAEFTILAGSIGSVISSFGNLEGESSKLVRGLSTFAFSIGTIKTVLDSFSSTQRNQALSKIGGGALGSPKNGFNRSVAFGAKNVDHFNLGIAAAGSALLIFGQHLEESALATARTAKSEEELNSALRTNTGASAAKGGGIGLGVGAAIGTAILPGIGTVVGGIVGGIGGSIVGAINNGNEKLIQAFKQARFDRISEDMTTLFEDFSSGRIDKGSATTNLSGLLKNQLSSIAGGSDAEQRASLRKQLRGDLPNIRAVTNSLIEQSSSITDFESKFGNAGETFISTIQVLTNKTYPQVRKEIENEINVRKQAKEVNAKFLSSLKNFDIINVKLNDFVSAVQDSSDALNNLTPAFEAIVANISGEVSTGKFGPNGLTSGIFGRAAEGQIKDDKVVESAARRLVGGLKGGLSGEGIVSNITDISKLTRELPGIIERASARTGLGANGEQAALAFDSEFDNTLKGFNKVLASTVKDIFSAQLSDRQTSGDSGFKVNSRENLNELVNKLIPDIIKNIGKQLDEVAKNIEQQTNVIADRLSQQVKIELDLAKQRSDIEEKRLEVEQAGLKDGKTLSLERVNKAFNNQQTGFLSGTGVIGPGNASSITEALQDALNRRTAAAAKIQTAAPGEEAANAQKEFAAVNLEATRLRAALDNLARSTLQVSKVQEELAKQEQDRQASGNLIDELLFGDASGRVDFSKGASAITGVLKGGGSIADLPAELRKITLDLVKKLPENRESPLLGNKTPQEFIESQREIALRKRAGLPGEVATGATPEMAAKLFTLSTKGTDKEVDLRKKLVDLQTESKDALIGLSSITDSGLKELKESNATALSEFSTKIEAAILQTILSERTGARESKTNKIIESKSELKRLNEVSNFVGGDINTANRILANKDSLQKIGEARQSLEGLRKVRTDATVTDFSPGKINSTFFGRANKEDINKSITSFLETDVINKSFNNDEKENFRKKISNRLSGVVVEDRISGTLPEGSLRFKNNKGEEQTQTVKAFEEALASGRDVGRIQTSDLATTSRVFGALFKQGIKDAFRERETSLANNMAAPSLRLRGAGLPDNQVERFSNPEELGQLENLLSGLSEASRNGSVDVDALTKSIRGLITEVNSIKGQEADIQSKINKAQGKAFGGLIGGRGINKPLVSFSPSGSDRIPAMLSRGEFVVRRDAAQANLPLLQQINAQGFARGGKVDKAGRAARRAAFLASRNQKGLNALDLSVDEAASARARGFKAESIVSKRIDVRSEEKIAAAKRNREDAFVEGISVKQLLENRRKVERDALTARIEAINATRAKASSERGKSIEGRRKDEAFLRSEREFSGLSPASSKIPTPSRLLKAVGFKGIKRAAGGPVPGSGFGDTVPSLLTPDEFVLNKRAAASIGLNNLSRFNGGGLVGGKPITGSGDRQPSSLLNAFTQALAPLSSSMSMFSQNASSLSNSLSNWTQSANKIAEAMLSFPSEVQVQHSQIPVIVSVAGLQGLQENIQQAVMAEVNSKLSLQTAKATDGKAPFFTGA